MIISIPKSTLVYITNQYNLDCVHCAPYAGANSLEKKDIMNTNDLATVIKSCSDAGIKNISLTGGEPFTRKDLTDVLRNIKGLKLKISINSNLIFLPDSIEEIISEELIDELLVSIDGAVAETHDRLRGTGNFNKTIHNIERLQNISNQHAKSLSFSFTTVPTAYNYKELQGVVELARNMGAKKVRFEHLAIAGNAKLHNKELPLDGKRLIEAYETILYYILNSKSPAVL